MTQTVSFELGYDGRHHTVIRGTPEVVDMKTQQVLKDKLDINSDERDLLIQAQRERLDTLNMQRTNVEIEIEKTQKLIEKLVQNE